MSTRVLDIHVYIVHSDPDAQTLAGASTLRTVDDTAETAVHNIIKMIQEGIPKDRVCSLVLTQKNKEYEENGEDEDGGD